MCYGRRFNRSFTHQHRITHERVPARRVGGRKDVAAMLERDQTDSELF